MYIVLLYDIVLWKRKISYQLIDEQDTHQIMVIGVAFIVPYNALADSIMDEISVFVEENI